MGIATWQGHIPRIHPSAWIHGSAEIIGEVELAEDVSVWPTCVMRGDNGHIKLGARTNFQDGSIAHATLGLSNTTVGIECTIGHRAVLHGCTVGDHCLIGIGATVLDGAELGDWCFVGAGSLVTPGKKFPPRSFILGSPAKVVREVSQRDVEWIGHSWQVYVELAKQYRSG